MGKAERRVSLTKEEIKALCEEAADKAVERSEKARKKSIAQEKKILLYNTKKLLENYTKLKDYAEKAVCTIDEAEQVDESIVNMDVLYGFRIFDEDKTLHRQLKGINAVKFMLAHVDRMLEVYQRECETSSNEIIQRRWKVIQMMYLDREKKKSTTEPGVYQYTPEMGGAKPDCQMEASRGYYGGHWFIDTPLEIKGRGITFLKKYTDKDFCTPGHYRVGWNEYRVTNKAFDKLKEQYTISQEVCLD